MPIYKVNGDTYNIPEEKQQAFEKKYPDAFISYMNGSDEYEIPVAKRDAFVNKFPEASLKSFSEPSIDNQQDLEEVQQPNLEANLAPVNQSTQKPEQSVQASEFPMFDDEPQAPLAPEKVEENSRKLRGLWANVKESSKGIGAGLKGYAGELLNLFTGSSREEQAALNDIEQLEKQGIDVMQYLADNEDAQFQKFYGMSKDKFLSLDKKERKRLVSQASDRMPEQQPFVNPDELREQRRQQANQQAVRDAFNKALQISGGDLTKAKAVLREQLVDKTKGDVLIEEATETMNNLRQPEGFAGWVGNLLPQMIPSAAAIAINYLTKGRASGLSKALGYGTMGGLTLSTAGMSMIEARESGATNLEVWTTGIADGAIEIISEMIPFDRVTKRVFSSAKANVAEKLGDAVLTPKGRKELEKLLSDANEKLGGKLFSKKNVKEWLTDTAYEAAGEFTAEALQTITTMIYENPEDYPTISDVLLAGWEGAKAGLFMGSVTGGASLAASHAMNKERRQTQGYVDVAQIENENGDVEVVEVVGENPEDGTITILHGDTVENVSRDKIGDRFRFSYEEFENGRLRSREDDAIDNGVVNDGQIRGMEETIQRDLEELQNFFTAEEINQIASGTIPANASAEGVAAARRYMDDVQRIDDLHAAKAEQDQKRKDAVRDRIESEVGQRFWVQEEGEDDGSGVVPMTETVEEVVYADGRVGYVVGSDEAGNLTMVYNDGSRGFSTRAEIAEKESSGEILSNTVMGLDDYLAIKVDIDDVTAETTRMEQEQAANVQSVQAAHPVGSTINVGTAEAKVEVPIIAVNADGAIVQMPDGTTPQLTWADIAHAEGQEVKPKTNVELDQEVVDEYKVAYQPAVKTGQEPSFTEREVEVEQTTPANPLPLKADGSVDQTALWNKDPERWAQWNDEQRQDGGANTLAYVNGAIAKEQAKIAELQAAYAAESDFDARDAIEKEIADTQARVERLTAIQQGYVAQAEAAAAPVVETEQVAPRVVAQASEQEMERVDTQYDGILKQTRIKEERVRILQEYLDKISEGSLQAFVLTSDNYADVMRREGCSEGVIAVVGMHLEAGENIGGFTSGGKLFLMEDGLPSIEEARITYIHERQHVFNTKNPAFVKAIASIADKQMLLSWLTTFVGPRGLNPYKSLSAEQLADEVVARCMEIAYTTKEFSVDLQSRGIPSEIISIITDIDNEQRKDQNLLNSRRGTRRDTYADVSSTGSLREDGRNIEQISGGVLGQEATRPSSVGEEGVGSRSTGEGAEVISEEQLSAPNSGEAQQITATDGEVLADTNGKGGVRFSIRTWNEGGRDYLAAWLASDTTLTEEEKADILARMDEFYKNALLYSDTYAPFGTWSDAGVRYDNNGNPLMSVIKANGDYAMNLDFSLVCKKRRPLNRLLRTLVNRNAFATYTLRERELAEINWILQEHGFEVACALCFVDSKRYRVTGVADVFAALYNRLVKSLAPEGVQIAHFNYNENPNVEVVENGLDTMSDDQLDWDRFDRMLSAYKPGSVEHKVAQYLREHPEARKLVDATDFIEAEGFESVKENNPDLLKFYNMKKGTGGPKASFGDVQYLNDILKKEKSFDAEKAYAVGGVRLQSFSDFVPHMYFDYMQLFAELAAKKLPLHAYTKEVLFAKIFGLTGAKINMSLVPAVVEGGIAPGLDAEGNYAWADPVTDAEGNVIQQGQSFPYDEAMVIQQTEGYSKNCGVIAVGISDAHIEKMLDDPNIPFIIPYHKSSLNAIVARMTNIDQYKDYTNVQNTRKASGSKLDKGTKDFNFNEYLHDLGESGTPQQAAQAYLDWCRENNYKPKFSQFAYHPNYYKLLQDFNTIDLATGEYAPQGAVTMTFPTEESAFGNVETLIQQGLQEDAELEEKMEQEIDGIADQVLARLEEISKEPKMSEKQQAKKMAELADERTAKIKAKAKGPIDLIEEAKKSVENDVMFRFIGEQAAINFDRAQQSYELMNNLEVAREMLQQDVDARKIKAATGWEMGADGRWRLERPDFEFKAKPGKKKTFKLSELIEDTSLFAEYPQLKNMKVRYKKLPNRLAGEVTQENGEDIILINEENYRAYNPTYEQAIDEFTKMYPEIAKLIYSGNAGSLTAEQRKIFMDMMGPVLALESPYIEEMGGRNTLAHEIQHLIQKYEGFAEGGSEDMTDTTDPNDAKRVQELRRMLSVEIDIVNDMVGELNDILRRGRAFEAAGNRESAIALKTVFDKKKREYQVHMDNVNYLKKELRKFKTLGAEGYKKLAGEVEARNVEKRLNMTEADRRQSLYSDTQDVATGDQIFLRNNLMTTYASETLVPGHKKGQPMLSDAEMMADVSFRITKNTKATIEKWFNKAGVDAEMTEATINYLDYVFEDTTEQLCAAKWYLNGKISLPDEDEYKVRDAVKVAKQNKVDALSYASPMDILNTFGQPKSKVKPINPDTIKEFSNKKELAEGIVVYDVQDDFEGQAAVRKIIDTHWGEDANPWCLAARTNGDLERAKDMWLHYSKYPKRIAFRNGKLLAFYASANDKTWWDRNDEPHTNIPYSVKSKEGEYEVSTNYELKEGNKKAKKVSVGKSDKKGRTAYFVGNRLESAGIQDGERNLFYSSYSMGATLSDSTYGVGRSIEIQYGPYKNVTQISFERRTKDEPTYYVRVGYGNNGVRAISFVEGARSWDIRYGINGDSIFVGRAQLDFDLANELSNVYSGAYHMYRINDEEYEIARGIKKVGIVKKGEKVTMQMLEAFGEDGAPAGALLDFINDNGWNRSDYPYPNPADADLLRRDDEVREQIRKVENEINEIAGGRYLSSVPAIRFRITPEQDKAYMDAAEAGDMETAQRMVIEAAKIAMPNTKVVDEDGNPKVVYHGSTAMFTVFDKSRIGSATGTADGRGFYFTTDRDYALGYKTSDGQLFEVFLNIEKPLSYDKKTITKAQLRKILKEADRVEYEQEGEHYMLSNYANYNDVGIDAAVNEAANLEYDYADNDVELVGSLIGGSGSFDLIMDAVKKVTGKSGMIAPKDNGTIHYVVTDPAGIKSAEPVTYDNDGNVIPLSERFNEEKDDIRFRTSNNNQAIFVSNAAKAVEGIKMEKATPEQWLKMIEKNGGLKAGEDKWVGLSDFLKASDKKTLTKQEVLDFINEHMIQIEEQHYSNEEMGKASVKILNERYQGWEDAFSFEWDGYMEEPSADISDYEAAVELYNKHHDDKVALDEDGEFEDMDTYEKVRQFGVELSEIYHGSKSEVRPIDGTREQYTTRGLQHLHEIALTVPSIEPWNVSDETHFGDAGDGRAVAWIRFGDTQITEEGSLMEYEPKSDVEREIKNYIEYAMRNGDDFETSVGYAYNQITDAPQESVGWTEEAVTAVADGMRGKEKVRKVLVIDEIQSKRHQEGREKGYRVSDIEQWLSDNNVEVVESGEFYEFIKNGETDRRFSKGLMNYDIEKAKRLYVSGYNKSDIPDAPFEKNWHELAMKRMLRYAAENGYDVVAWTTGDQQADRYDLSRDVKKISASKPTKDGERIVNIYYRDEYNDFKNLVVDKEGKVVQGDYSGNALADVIGKEMALQIMSAEDSTEFKGEGLKIGGEGMRGFYDKMLPAFMNKYGKKWGVKVEDIDLPNLGKSGRTMHSVPVTEEMKASVMEGQVMFRTTQNPLDAPLTVEERVKINEFFPGFATEEDIRFKTASLEKRARENFAKTLYAKVLQNQFNDVTLQEIDKFIQDAAESDSYEFYKRLPEEAVRDLVKDSRESRIDALISRISESEVPAADRGSERGREQIERKKKELLKGWAIASGMWYNDLSDVKEIADTTPLDKGTDSAVYLGSDGEHVVKVKHGKPFGKRFRPDIDDLALYNHVFPESAYTIIGYGDFGEGISTIVMQPIINFDENYLVSVDERVEFMKEIGFEPINKDKTAFTNGYIVASDIQRKNIVRDMEGDIYVIDADMKLHTKELNGKHVIPPVEKDWGGGPLFRVSDRKNITSEINTNPTEAQKKAGNYKMVHIRLDGYNITIENPKGSVRRGTDSKGNAWENTLNNDYGYIRGTEGVDRDHIDVYLSDNPAEGNVFVIDQINPETREFDEHKVMYGFDSAEEAREAYLANFSEGWDGLGTITEVSKDEFKKWIESSHRKMKPFSEYKSVRANEMQATDESELRYRVVSDQETLDRLNSEPTIKVYRAMQLIDGKLYPPMSAKVDGELRQPIELGQWEEAEERPDLVDEKGRFKLDKGNKSSLKARYNPYFHTSPTPLNDQFSSAQTRPELVTVEVEVPESELTSGYKAEKAKDSVGKMEWKAGVVQSKLSGTRTVILSRWDKPVRIVPDNEVADVIVDMFEGRDITMPSNVVTPLLRAELEKRGVPFVETDNQGNPVEEVSFRVTGTPTDEVVTNGLQLTPAQTAEVAANIFAAFPEESRKKITDGLNGNVLGLKDAILQIPASLASKENWNDEDKQMADVVAEEMTKIAGEMTRPFSAEEGLWLLYNNLNKGNDLISQASRALVQRNLGFDAETLAKQEQAKEDVRFRTVGDATSYGLASLYNRGAVNVWTRLKESFVDRMASVEELVKAIEKRTGKVAQGFENILLALNQQSSKGLAAMESYTHKFLNPMFDEIRRIMDETKMKYEDIVRYVILKHGLERNKKLAQRDARAHYQEIYDDIISKITGMTAAQKRTYLTNAQLKEGDAKAELATLQAVDMSAMTDEEKREHKKKLAAARKAVEEAEEHLKRAQKIASMSEQEAQDELDKIFEKIENGTDSVYKEMRENDYSGISSMFYDQLGVDRKNFSTEEQYQAALMEAKKDRYSSLKDVEAAAEAEVKSFEGKTDTKELWKRINAATKETLRQQYEANMISKDQYDNLRGMFEYYVPLRGFKDNTAEDMYTYYRKPNSTGYTKPILGAEGRKTEAESPFGWIAAMAGSAIASNVKNEAKLALYYFVSNRPENGIATISRTWFVDSGEVDERGKKIFKPAYPPFSEDLSSDAAKANYEAWQENMRELQKKGQAYEAGQRLNLGNAVVNISDANKPEHIVNVKVGGKDYTIIINGNPRAAQAINGDLNIEGTAQDYSALFGPVLRWMSSVNTSYNPEFWITNMMRDMAFTMMAVNIKEDPAYRRKFSKNYRKAFKVISLVAKNEKGTIGDSYLEQQYKDFVKYGGVTGYTQIKDSETWEQEIENYLSSSDPESLKSGKVMRGMKSAFHAAHRFGESLEQVSRFAAFLTARETGKSINEAIDDAKEITVNFNRKGSGKMITLEEAKYLTGKNGQPLTKPQQWMVVGLSSIAPLGRRFIMFFNAAIQGLNATYKLMKKNPKRFTGWALGYAAVGMMNAVLHAMLDDDDDYLDIPQYERRNSLMIGGNGAYFKWALPQEARAFYALGDLAVETVMGRNPHQNFLGEALKIGTEILPVNPSEGWKAFMPSVAIPFIELALNEDYKGAPIYNEQKWLSEEEKERTAKWSNAYQGTGWMYVKIAQGLNFISGGDKHDAGLINLQPEKLEHLVQSAFGGTIRTADKFINTISAAIDPEEPNTVRQAPFLNRFLTINDERFKNVHVNDVFDYYKADAEHALTLEKQYIKDRDMNSLTELRSSDEYQWAKIYGKYKKPLKAIQDKIKVADGTAEKKELMKQQDELKKRMIKEISEL